jgi:uncharacterized integral membrane protein
MRLRSLLLLLFIAGLVAFVAANWGAFLATTTLSLGLTTIEAPLGLVMLVLLGALTLAFVGFTAYMQTSAVRESRRSAKEVQTQRDLADRAEASRFTELRTFIENQMQQQAAREQASRDSILQRIDGIERVLHIPTATVPRYASTAVPIEVREETHHQYSDPVPVPPDRRHH